MKPISTHVKRSTNFDKRPSKNTTRVGKGAEEDSPERIRVGFVMPDVPIKGTGNSDELVTIRIVRALDT